MHASIAKARMSHSKTSFAATRLARTALVALPISFLSLIACEIRETRQATGNSPAHDNHVHDDGKGSADTDNGAEAVGQG